MSTLQVSNIAAAGGTTAMTIDGSGRVLTPARPSFQFDITNFSGGANYLATAYTFGQTGSPDITIAYMSPMPFINAISSGGDGFKTNVGSCASFVDHPVSSDYKYLKFTAPVAGLYCFGMVAHLLNKHSGHDYVGFGVNKNRVNNAASASTIDSTFDKPFIQTDMIATDRTATFSGTNIVDLAQNDYVVFHCRSVEKIEFQRSAHSFFGYLIG